MKTKANRAISCAAVLLGIGGLLLAGCGNSGGGTTGGRGGTGGAAGTTGGSDGGVPLGHGLIFDNGGQSAYLPFERCDANGGCSAGKICFRVTADLALCDTPQPIAATMCSSGAGGAPPDQCACNGSSCAADQVCKNVEQEGGGGLFGSYNDCVDTACSGPSDCAAGTTCTPSSFIFPVGYPSPVAPSGRCFQPLCVSDADCTDGNDGRCSLLLRTPTQNGGVRIVAVRCVYRGTFDFAAPDPSLCAGTRPVMTTLRDPPPNTGGFYYCLDLAH